MNFSLPILCLVVLLSACEQSPRERAARAHAEMQSSINSMNFERAERSREEVAERQEGQQDQKPAE